MLNIWGRISSLNVRKVVWCAQELGLDFQRTEAGGRFGVVQTREYLALNPNAMVPVIDDGEGTERVVLWESNVIVRYLCAKHSLGKLYPDLLGERFDAERWMDWQQTALNAVSGGAFVQWIRKAPDERDAAVIARSVNATEPLLAMLDTHLADRAYMAGDRFTMADIPIACELHRWQALPQPRPERKHLKRWYDAINARPAARGVFDLAVS